MSHFYFGTLLPVSLIFNGGEEKLWHADWRGCLWLELFSEGALFALHQPFASITLSLGYHLASSVINSYTGVWGLDFMSTSQQV